MRLDLNHPGDLHAPEAANIQRRRRRLQVEAAAQDAAIGVLESQLAVTVRRT